MPRKNQQLKTNPTLAIDVQGITKKFSGKTVVNHVDLQVKHGEIYGFLGPNGSGKTTFIRMLCGLLKPDAGKGNCLGHNVLTEQNSIKLKVGYMTQRFSLYEDLSIRENLDFVARLYGVKNRNQVVQERIESLGLDGRQKQLAGNLSGGWKQRLALAACMIHNPQLLLLDEPTAGVDPKGRRDFWDEIHSLAAEGLTVLITTHYMDEAERCHRLAYLAYGNLLTHGSLAEVIQSAGLNTWQVEGEALAKLKIELRKLPAVEQVVAFGNTLHVSGPDHAALEQTIKSYQNKKWQWTSISSSLEDVFIHLMSSSTDNFGKQGDVKK